MAVSLKVESLVEDIYEDACLERRIDQLKSQIKRGRCVCGRRRREEKPKCGGNMTR